MGKSTRWLRDISADWVSTRRRPTQSAETSSDQRVFLPIILYIPIYENWTVNLHVATKSGPVVTYTEINLIAFKQPLTMDCIVIWFVIGSLSYYLVSTYSEASTFQFPSVQPCWIITF